MLVQKRSLDLAASYLYLLVNIYVNLYLKGVIERVILARLLKLLC